MKYPEFSIKFRSSLRWVLAAGFILSAAFLFAGQKADGIVSVGEYDSSVMLDDGKVVVSWNFTADSLEAAISAKTAGWVSIGFDPVNVMEGADMVIGWVGADGKGTVVDCYSTGSFGPHPIDADLGGKDDLIARATAEQAGTTVIEFSRPRTVGDAFDKAVGPGTKFLWAYARSDNFDEQHAAAGYGILESPGGQSGDNAAKVAELSLAARNRGLSIVLPHALPLSLSFLCMLAGMLIARYGKKNRKWLSIHKPLGYSAAGLALIGLTMGVRLVMVTSGIHFRVPHAFLGAFTLLTAFAAPALGRAMFVFKKQAKLIRKLHRIVGRLAIIFMALTVFSGLVQAGIIKF